MKGELLPELSLAGANGSLYINIHAEQYPNIEIRGQIENPLLKRMNFQRSLPF
jgi:CHRD domain